MEENLSSPAFYSYRNIGKCLSAGISFFTDYFRHWLWLTLPLAVPLAVLMGLQLYLSSDMHLYAESAATFLTLLAANAVLLIILIVLFEGFVYHMINKHAQGIDLQLVTMRTAYTRRWLGLSLRALLTNVLVLIPILLVITVFVATAVWWIDLNDAIEAISFIAIAIIVLLIVLLLLLPAQLCLPSVMLNKGSFFKSFWTGYKWGWKKYGRVLALSLLVCIGVAIISQLLTLPASVLLLLQQAATASKLAGDAVDLPSYLEPFAITVLILSSYLSVLLMFVERIPMAYMYASVKTDIEEEESKKLPLI